MKQLIKKYFERFGYEILKKEPTINSFAAQQKLLKSIVNPVIFDVGAHHGQTALEYSNLFPLAKILSFEPFKDSFKILEANTPRIKNFNAYNFALGNYDGISEMNINNSTATNSILSTDDKAYDLWGKNLLETQTKVAIEIVTLDSFIQKNSINRIDVLKLDTQGSEYLIIEGAKNAIKNNKIKLVYTEIITVPTYNKQKALDEILYLFRNHGFLLYNFYNPATINNKLMQLDAIFIHESFSID